MGLTHTGTGSTAQTASTGHPTRPPPYPPPHYGATRPTVHPVTPAVIGCKPRPRLLVDCRTFLGPANLLGNPCRLWETRSLDAVIHCAMGLPLAVLVEIVGGASPLAVSLQPLQYLLLPLPPASRRLDARSHRGQLYAYPLMLT